MESFVVKPLPLRRTAVCSWKSWSTWFLSIPLRNKPGGSSARSRGRKRRKGNVLPFNDLMIAAAAIEQDYAVLTTNPRHFQKIPNLTVIQF